MSCKPKDDQSFKQWKDISQKISYTKTHNKKKRATRCHYNLQIGIILVNDNQSDVFLNKVDVQWEEGK